MTTIRRLLNENGIVLTKARGQNFLIDPGVCPRMAAECGAGPEDGVLEIGPGIGVLTAELAEVARKVTAVEVDEGLIPILSKTMAEYQNVHIIHGDVMKLNLAELLAEEFPDCKRVFVCANLPYYISTPILMLLLESGLPFAGITVMVQKEFAQRITAPVGSRDSGAVTVSVAVRAAAQCLFTVKSGCFFPAPKVDSTVMRLTPYDCPPVEIKDPALFRKMVTAGFCQRRKTLQNSLMSGLGVEKQEILTALVKLGISPTARIEELTLEQLAGLSDHLADETGRKSY